MSTSDWMRETNKLIEAEMKAMRDMCPHLQGSNCLSEFQGVLTCIVWHTFQDDWEHPVGICLNCQRVFRFTDPDYYDWISKLTACAPSSGGRTMKDPLHPVDPRHTPTFAAVPTPIPRDKHGFEDPWGYL